MQGPIKFTATAAQVDRADTTPMVMVDLSDARKLARVPVALLVFKRPGAYNVGADTRLEVVDERGAVWFSIPCVGFLDQVSKQNRLHMGADAAYSQPNSRLRLRFTGPIARGGNSPDLSFSLWYEQFNLDQ